VEREKGLLLGTERLGDPTIETAGRRELLTNKSWVLVEHELKRLHSVTENSNELSGGSSEEGIGKWVLDWNFDEAKKLFRSCTGSPSWDTSTLTRLHSRPHEPVEPKKSSTSEVHAPISWGLEINTPGTMGMVGEEMLTVIWGEVGKLEQEAGVQSTRRVFGNTVNRPNAETEDCEGKSIDNCWELCQEQVALSTPSNLNKEEQIKEVRNPARLMGISKAIARDWQDEKRAETKRG
jgi:hypothetical protein